MENITGKVGFVRPTFEEYPNRVERERHVIFKPSRNDYRYSISDLMSFFRDNPVETLFLINPDNPSGNFIPKNDVITLAEWCNENNVQLVVDESFVDFSTGYKTNTLLDDSILEKYQNLIVIKSISKSYGVPGIRLGILASANKDLIANLKKLVSIWNLNSFAEFFMQIFNKYEKDYWKACDRFITERMVFEENLRQIPFLRVMPSQANYFLCEVLPPYTANGIVLTMLKKYNILMRDCSSKEGFDGKQYIRIAVRNHKDNSKLIDSLKNI